MSLLLDAKRTSYQAQRTASQGAGITLVSGCGEYTATFGCAEHVADVMGSRELQDLGDGIIEVIPFYKIAVEDLYSALQKLSTRFSVALVEYAMTKNGGQFILLWRINPSKPMLTIDNPKLPPSTNLDDY